MLEVTLSEYRDYMVLIENKISEYRDKWRGLQTTLDNWNDILHPTSKTSGLTQEEIKDLQNSFKQRQHEYFLKWYNMNENLRSKGLDHWLPQKIRDIGSNLIGISSYKDLLAG